MKKETHSTRSAGSQEADGTERAAVVAAAASVCVRASSIPTDWPPVRIGKGECRITTIGGISSGSRIGRKQNTGQAQ